MRNTHTHTVVGLFHVPGPAYEALHRLDDDGLAPAHVAIVAGDRELAGEVASHSHAFAGALGGFVLGLAVTVVYVAMGGPGFARNVVGIALGAAFMSFGLGFIGLVFGRALLVHAPHRSKFEHLVRDGGAIVTVECVGGECDHARHVLESAAADEIVDEES